MVSDLDRLDAMLNEIMDFQDETETGLDALEQILSEEAKQGLSEKAWQR